MRALSLPGCACRGAFQFAVLARLARAGERFDLVAGASSGSVSGAAVVAGMAEEGPALVRRLMSTPLVSRRYLATEKSIFGMGAILRDVVSLIPEERLRTSSAELLVATTIWSRFARSIASRGTSGDAGLVVHSNRTRERMHDAILASCWLPVLYAGLVRIDGEVHVDGGAADNTLIDVLAARGAREITVITPYPEGAVSRTIFSPELVPEARESATLRVIYPVRRLSMGRFDFAPEALEEALTMPHAELVIPPRAAANPGADLRAATSPG